MKYIRYFLISVLGMCVSSSIADSSHNITGTKHRYSIPGQYIKHGVNSLFGKFEDGDKQGTVVNLRIPAAILGYENDTVFPLLIFADVFNDNKPISESRYLPDTKYSIRSGLYYAEGMIGQAKYQKYWSCDENNILSKNHNACYFVKTLQLKIVEIGGRKIIPKITCNLYTSHDGLSLKLALVGKDCNEEDKFQDKVKIIKKLLDTWIIEK